MISVSHGGLLGRRRRPAPLEAGPAEVVADREGDMRPHLRWRAERVDTVGLPGCARPPAPFSVAHVSDTTGCPWSGDARGGEEAW